MVYFNRHLVANRIKVDLCAHSLITTVKEARGAAGVAVVIAQPFSSVTINDSSGKHLLSVCLDHCYIFCTFSPCFCAVVYVQLNFGAS